MPKKDKNPKTPPTSKFPHDANSVLELIEKGYSIVLVRDGLGGVTAIAAEGDALTKPAILGKAVKAWQASDSMPEPMPSDATEAEQMNAIQRSIFEGADKYTGAGVGDKAVAMALNALTEKALRNRRPGDKPGEYIEKPRKYVRPSRRPKAAKLIDKPANTAPRPIVHGC